MDSAENLERLFPGNSEMAQLMRTFDWSSSAIGAPAKWPASLKAAVRICIESSTPMVIWWGKTTLTQLYNDNYIEILTPDKHPQALGQSGNECWREIHDTLHPLWERVLDTGDSLLLEDFPRIANYNVQGDERCFTLSFNALRDDDGNFDGILCMCHEATRKASPNAISETAQPYTTDTATNNDRLTENLNRVVRRAFAPALWLAQQSKRAEQALKASEEQFRALLQASSDVVYLMSPDWTEMRNLVGRDFIPDTEEPNRSWLQIYIHPADQARVMDIIQQAIKRKDVFELEHRVLRVDGSLGWTHSRAIPILDTKGNITDWFGMASDITERKQAQDVLSRELEDAVHLQKVSSLLIKEDNGIPLYNAILDAAIAIMNADFGSIQLLDAQNQTLQLITCRGFPTESARWKKASEATETSSSAALLKGQRIIIPDVHDTSFMSNVNAERQYLLSDIASAQSTPLITREGRMVGMISTQWNTIHTPGERELRLLDILARQAADFIERHRARKDLRQAKEQLEDRVVERTAELTLRTEQLQALAGEITLATQRERRQLAELLHDHLQQLLVAAQFRASILTEKDDTEVRAIGLKLEELLQECLAKTRSLTAELCPPMLEGDGFADLLNWLVCSMAERHDLNITLDIPHDLPPLTEQVHVLLYESVRELLLNVIKHSEVRSAHISARQEGQQLRVEISDGGKGFNLDAIRKGGRHATGFGLFSIGERVDLLGGQMQIESSDGAGCRVTLSIPVTAEAPPLADIIPLAPWKAEYAVAPANAHDRVRVLIADDHAVVREGLVLLLARDPNLEIVGEAADGQQAVELARKLRPSVVLMDISMPKMNGLEATRQIHSELPDIRIIALSMIADAERIRAMIEAGAIAHVDKSGPSSELLHTIRECITPAVTS